MNNKRAFTLIEIVVYCAIFVTFAVSVIESMIWINSKMSLEDSLTEIRSANVYKIYFANIYKRYKINNKKIEDGFKELISSTSTIEENGIILNQIQSDVGGEREKYKIILFDSIDNGV